VQQRWDGWIDLMKGHGLIRFLSKKGCSPDSSAAEGLFGRLKVEMYFGEGWDRCTLAELREAVDEYLHCYNAERIKVSLGGLSPLQYRRKLGLRCMTIMSNGLAADPRTPWTSVFNNLRENNKLLVQT
jgi:transposase InsO family protein